MEPEQDQPDADSLDATRRLYPELSDEELEDTKEVLDQYAKLVARITERLATDPKAYEEFRKLLEEKENPTA